MTVSFLEIKQAIDQTATAFDEFKKTNDERLAALRAGNEAKARELDQKLERINADINKFVEVKDSLTRELEFHRERLEQLEAKGMAPGRTGVQQVHDEYKQAFCEWIRNRGQSPEAERKMIEIGRKAQAQYKDVTIGSGSAGGFAVPESISATIEKLELKFSPVRALVKVVQTSTSDYKELVSINGATSGWVGESGARTATATPTLREVTPTHGELYAYPQASEWSLDDIAFDVEAWLAENVAEQFAIAEANAVLTGDGTNKPTGMLNSAPTAVSDEAGTRGAAVYEFVANVDASFNILPDRLFDLFYKLNAAYRSNSTWVMNSATAGAVRKIKDSTGQYLWQPSLIVGQPDTLISRPVSIWEQMQSPGANNHPIAFGDFRRGYVLADRVGLRITRDNVTNIGYVRWYIRRREGGIVLNNNAIKWLKTTAT